MSSSAWDSSPDTPIYERYTDCSDLLDKLSVYYPQCYDEANLDQAGLLGRGLDAYAFCVNQQVVKFTQSSAHAQVSLKLSRTPHEQYPHLVDTYSCHEVPSLGLWCITEERLNKMSSEHKQSVCDFMFEGTPDPGVEEDIDSIRCELDDLGVHEWDNDCVHVHNMLVRGSHLVAFDFGYTRSKFSDDFPRWAS